MSEQIRNRYDVCEKCKHGINEHTPENLCPLANMGYHGLHEIKKGPPRLMACSELFKRIFAKGCMFFVEAKHNKWLSPEQNEVKK